MDDLHKRPALAALERWFIEAALPLWATSGFDEVHGRFEECLDTANRAIVDAPLRLMVQARQIHVFANAATRGWFSGADALASRAFETMCRAYHRRDGRDGWVFSLSRDGGVADPTRDLYAHAFVLLAISSYLKMSGDRSVVSLADETLAFVDGAMKAPAGGWLEAVPAPTGPRRQNPHMHLFEALLLLWTSSGERRYLERADQVLDLFMGHFFRQGDGVLLEYFDNDLAPAPGAEGSVVEPGHHYEWCWLLRTYQASGGTHAAIETLDALYRHALRYGSDREGFVVDEVTAAGKVRTPSRRLWPMAEAIRCNIAEAAAGRSGAADRAEAQARLLRARFLTPSGGWTDRLDAEGRALVDRMPASSLYHLYGAVAASGR